MNFKSIIDHIEYLEYIESDSFMNSIEFIRIDFCEYEHFIVMKKRILPAIMIHKIQSNFYDLEHLHIIL